MTPLEAAAALAAEHGLRYDEIVVLKHGSNLLVRLAPAQVVLRIATFTALIRGDPLPFLEREVSLVSYLASVATAQPRDGRPRSGAPVRGRPRRVRPRPG